MDAQTPISELRVDGGAAKNDLLLQFQADLLQTAGAPPCHYGNDGAGSGAFGGVGGGDLEKCGRPRNRRGSWIGGSTQAMGVDEVRHQPVAAGQRRLSRALDWESPVA